MMLVMTISETLRKAYMASEETQAEMSRATDIAESVLSRFASGDGLRSTTLDRLCEHLNLVLVVKQPKRSSKRRKGH